MRILTGIESKGISGCPGQPPSEISSLPDQKIPIPRPPGGGLRVRRSSSRKNSNFKISELKCIWSLGGDPWCFEHTRYMIFHVVSLVLHKVMYKNHHTKPQREREPCLGHLTHAVRDYRKLPPRFFVLKSQHTYIIYCYLLNIPIIINKRGRCRHQVRVHSRCHILALAMI